LYIKINLEVYKLIIIARLAEKLCGRLQYKIKETCSTGVQNKWEKMGINHCATPLPGFK
jgi:hypothetical protein